MQPQDSVTVGLAGGYDELPVGKSFDHLPEGTKQCMFWGVGSDGLEQGGSESSALTRRYMVKALSFSPIREVSQREDEKRQKCI